jgi:hypothetical protein
MEAIQQTWSGTADLGNTATCTISRNGDLIYRTYIECTNGGTDTLSGVAVANIGSAIIDNVILEIGGQQIDKQYGHWMEVWAELTEPNDGGIGGNVSGDADLVNGTKFQNMTGFGGVKGHATAVTTPLTIPLFFWFCRNPGLALPLIALQYHEVKITATFNAPTSLAKGGDFNLWVDYIYLDTDERRRFAQVSHEYLIEQIQFIQTTSQKNHDLNFNHPVKELIWTGGTTTSPSTTASTSTPRSIDTGEEYHLELNGHQRFAPREYRYFTKTQVWQHHTGYGGVSANGGGLSNAIGVYSFALKPEDHQPSGTCNFSRIDNAILVSKADETLNIYAVNYNVLRIMSGMGGLAYSN